MTPSTSIPDRIRVHPGVLTGEVRVPGDKSCSHRALILGALTGASVELDGLVPSADVLSTARALRTLGATVELTDDGVGGLSGRISGPLGEPSDVLDCGNSGTSLRLLAGVVAGIDGISVLTGDGSLRTRPMGRVAEPLRRLGADVDGRANGALPPLVIRGGRLHAITYDSTVASAQVKSAILLAGLRADGRTTVTSPSRSRDHTERLLLYLGADLAVRHLADGREHVEIEPGPLRPRPIRVLGDPSSAAFWMVAGVAGRSEVRLPGLCANPTRLGVVAVLRAMGASIEVSDEGEVSGEPAATITVGAGELGAAVVEGATVVDAIDELPVLAVAGAVSSGGLEVRDAAELRVKESDRIETLARGLRAIGVEIETRPDGFHVPGGQRPRGGTVDAAGDHRIAMTACIAALLATAPVEIRGFSAVGTSYPGFLDDLGALGGVVEAA